MVWIWFGMNNTQTPLQSRPPSDNERIFTEFAARSPLALREYISHFAEKLLTLSPAMLAAYVGGLKFTDIQLKWYLFVPIALLIFSLAAAIWVIFPRKKTRPFNTLNSVQEYLTRRSRLAHFAISFGLACFGIGILLGALFILA